MAALGGEASKVPVTADPAIVVTLQTAALLGNTQGVGEAVREGVREEEGVEEEEGDAPGEGDGVPDGGANSGHLISRTMLESKT